MWMVHVAIQRHFEHVDGNYAPLERASIDAAYDRVSWYASVRMVLLASCVTGCESAWGMQEVVPHVLHVGQGEQTREGQLLVLVWVQELGPVLQDAVTHVSAPPRVMLFEHLAICGVRMMHMELSVDDVAKLVSLLPLCAPRTVFPLVHVSACCSTAPIHPAVCVSPPVVSHPPVPTPHLAAPVHHLAPMTAPRWIVTTDPHRHHTCQTMSCHA